MADDNPSRRFSYGMCMTNTISRHFRRHGLETRLPGEVGVQISTLDYNEISEYISQPGTDEEQDERT